MTHSQQRIARFRELFAAIQPAAQMPVRVAKCAEMLCMSESSVRVYLMDSPPHAISQRSLDLLEREMKRRRLI
jgi:hypothetical protein